MKRLLPAVFLVLAGNACADSVPINFWTSAERPTYVQVPSYQHYRNVQLVIQPSYRPKGVQAVEIWLDGKPVGQQPVGVGESQLQLPDLLPGGHEFRLRTLGPVAPGECAATGRTLPLQSAELRFTPERLGEPVLARLPDGLYQSNPGALSVGTLRADQWNDATLSAALGVAQALSSRHNLLWQAGSPQDFPANFTVTLKRVSTLKGPLRLELKPGTLNVLYRQETDLPGAVSLLATPQYRSGLLAATADLTTLPALPKPRLIAPHTLAEYGLSDYRVWSGRSVTQAIRLPALWEPGGPVTGKLHYHMPLPPSGREQVLLNVGRYRIDVSPTAAQRSGQDSVIVPYRGETLGPNDGLAFKLSAANLSNTCDAALRVDPSTTVDFRARLRSGIASLPRLLAYNPVVHVEHTPEAIALALNVAVSLESWGLQGALPWKARFGESGEPATLTIRQGQVGTRGAVVQMNQGLLRQPQVFITASGSSAFKQLAQDWHDVPRQLTNDLEVIEIRSGGEVVSGPALFQAQAEIPQRERRWALLFSLITLPLAGLFWWYRDRQRQRKGEL